MLTRIEINGFKTFADFKMDLPPFLVVVGENAVGKSNLFDAIRLLSRLAKDDVSEAVKSIRGEPIELFRRSGSMAPTDQIRIAVEVLLGRNVTGPWGKPIAIRQQRIRYEIGLKRIVDERGVEYVIVDHEYARAISRKEDGDFRYAIDAIAGKGTADNLISYQRRANPYLTLDPSGREFKLYQDGGQGRPARAVPRELAQRSILSEDAKPDFPHLYALRQHLRSIRFLELDASAMRRNPRLNDPDRLSPSGGNLPAVLHRLKVTTATQASPMGVLAEIGLDLGRLVSGVSGVDVEEDATTREYRLKIATRTEGDITAGVASEGTLRLLALLTLLHDPVSQGPICFEEPENGIHPSRLAELVRQMKDDVVESLRRPTDMGEPLQIICNSHSPVVLEALQGPDLHCARFFDLVTVTGGGTVPQRRTRWRSFQQDDLFSFGKGEPKRAWVTPAEADNYLRHAGRAAE